MARKWNVITRTKLGQFYRIRPYTEEKAREVYAAKTPKRGATVLLVRYESTYLWNVIEEKSK